MLCVKINIYNLFLNATEYIFHWNRKESIIVASIGFNGLDPCVGANTNLAVFPSLKDFPSIFPLKTPTTVDNIQRWLTVSQSRLLIAVVSIELSSLPASH